MHYTTARFLRHHTRSATDNNYQSLVFDEG